MSFRKTTYGEIGSESFFKKVQKSAEQVNKQVTEKLQQIQSAANKFAEKCDPNRTDDEVRSLNRPTRRC